MTVSSIPFGAYAYGKQAFLYTLTNGKGWSVDLTNLGAAVRAVRIPGRDGKLTDVVLCHGDFDDCLDNLHDLGAICGRIHGRLSKSGFRINGRYHELIVRNGRGLSNERGLSVDTRPFSCAMWQTVDSSAGRVTFALRSPDGEQGLPGNLDVTVAYTWDENGRLGISCEAVSDADTAVDLTNNLFVNLGGLDGDTIFDHKLSVFADSYMNTGQDFCVTGEILPAEGTPMDFNKPATVGGRVNGEFFYTDKADIGVAQGNTEKPETEENQEAPREPRLRARVSSPKTGISMSMYTDLPVIRMDTGASLLAYRGKNGAACVTNGALCLSASLPPDAVNRRGLPSPILPAGQKYHRRTDYVFTPDT